MTLLGRITGASSGRSVGNNSHDAENASVATFEFDMDVVRDSDQSKKRRSIKRGFLSIGIADQCDSSGRDRQPHGMLHSMREDHDSDAVVSGTAPHDSEPSDRHNSYRSSGSTFSSLSSILPNRTVGLSILIGLIGLLSSTLFLGFGIAKAVHEENGVFEIRAREVTQEFNSTWDDHIKAASWVYASCAFHNITREEFSHLYYYLTNDDNVQAVEWIPKVLNKDRQSLEQESRAYYETHYPQIDYRGITGFQLSDPNNPNSTSTLQYRSTEPFYYPVHFIEPINQVNAPMIDIDVVTSKQQDQVLQLALDTFKPVATQTYERIKPGGGFTNSSYIKLFHPGIPLPGIPNQKPRDVAAIVVSIEGVVEQATRYMPEALSFYIYDSTNEGEEPQFVIAAEAYHQPLANGKRLLYLEEISLSELVDETVFFIYIAHVQVAQRTWTVAFVALENTFIPNLRYIIMTGKFILAASLCVSLWIMTNHRRIKTMNDLKRKADLEKTAVVVRSARENAKAEQELNDYIAHEVRNPLAAAMSACTFVKSAVNEQNPMVDEEALKAVREDVEIIDSSLTFTHDLLRNMLDMHRAASKKLFIEEVPLDVMHDVLQPVLAMLYNRNKQFEILAECPNGLYILSDRIRLKQILLNLCRNSARYVQKGFIKIGATVVDGNVQLFVEDSGLGIADERKKYLFSKFQESLNVMDQGSGVGLCLCKSMVALLGGDIWLDEKFDSGVSGYRGSRFVIGLNKPPMPEKEIRETVAFFSEDSDTSTTNEETYSNPGSNKTESSKALPSSLPTPRASLASKKVPSVESMFDDKDPHSAAMPLSSLHSHHSGASSEDHLAVNLEEELPTLPEKLSVLFVDDDMILRKLFMRSVRKVINTWDIQEAASGEAALKLTDTTEFDLIFMDQYMASVEKKLLGTETVRALRAKGVHGRICGLSANDVEEGFWKAGADCFLFKPFPCKKEQLQVELHRILNMPRHPTLETLAGNPAAEVGGGLQSTKLSFGEEELKDNSSEVKVLSQQSLII